MDSNFGTGRELAANITKVASRQTYYTIRFLIDRELVDDAYRAYAYFRWVDDVVDEHLGSKPEKIAFINRQKELLEACYAGTRLKDLCPEERMLAKLVQNDDRENPNLESYLRNMMAVMEFDAERRGRVITQVELTEYTRSLSIAVTDAMYYFIGHDEPATIHKARYQSVTAAHITHMLRDMQEDIQSGYFNVPQGYLHVHNLPVTDTKSQAIQQWVCNRVKLARKYFREGRESIDQNTNLRRRLAGYAYTARFEWILRTIESDNFCLRSEYHGRKSLWASLWMTWSTLVSLVAPVWSKATTGGRISGAIRIKEL